MYKTVQNKLFFSVERIWFSNTKDSSCDIIRYERLTEPLQNKWYTNIDCEETVFSDLSNTTEEILSKSTKTIKYEVNKCMKECINITTFSSDDLKNAPSIIKDFTSAYTELVKETHNNDLMKALSLEKIMNWMDSGNVTLSKAEKNDCYVYHLYTNGDKECVLMYSASNFRSDDKNARNLTGRMNKLLHIRDMEYFRERGVKTY